MMSVNDVKFHFGASIGRCFPTELLIVSGLEMNHSRRVGIRYGHTDREDVYMAGHQGTPCWMLPSHLAMQPASISTSIFDVMKRIAPSEHPCVQIDASSIAACHAELSIEEAVNAVLEGIHLYLKSIIAERRPSALEQIGVTLERAECEALMRSFCGLKAFFDQRSFRDDCLFLTLDATKGPLLASALSSDGRDLKIIFKIEGYRPGTAEVYRVATRGYFRFMARSQIAFSIYPEKGRWQLYLTHPRDPRWSSAHGIISQAHDLIYPTFASGAAIEKGHVDHEGGDDYILSDLRLNPFERVTEQGELRESQRRLSEKGRQVVAFFDAFGIRTRVDMNEHKPVYLFR
jgi:hypothetical protein